MTRTIAALALAMSMTALPAYVGVSKEVRAACEKKADQQQPPLRAPEREAFIANCLADATADKGKQ